MGEKKDKGLVAELAAPAGVRRALRSAMIALCSRQGTWGTRILMRMPLMSATMEAGITRSRSELGS